MLFLILSLSLMKKIFLRFLNAMLAFLLFFQVISAFYGGILLVISPGGEKLQMPLTFLEGSPFRNYLLPGLILLVLLGVFPALAFAGFVFRDRKSVV